MFYVKAKINDDIEIKVNIYGDDIFTDCMDCGKEIQIDDGELQVFVREGLSSISTFCKECTAKRLITRTEAEQIPFIDFDINVRDGKMAERFDQLADHIREGWGVERIQDNVGNDGCYYITLIRPESEDE